MITHETIDGVCQARVTGEMTIYAAAEDRAALQHCLQAGLDTEIDLSEVTEIDSAGVQLLIQAKRHGAQCGHAVRLVRHSAAVQEIIDLYRLAPEFGDLMVIAPQ